MSRQNRPGARSMQSVIWLVVLLMLFAFYYFYTRQPAPAPATAPTATPALAAADAATAPPVQNSAAPTAIPATAPAPDPTVTVSAPTATSEPQAVARGAKATPTRGPPATIDGLPTITPDELPPEALETLALIDDGGPFPFSRDGIVFQNREGLLPRQPGGYYHEYTVITPGSSDRGARRIIAGEEGERYYTDDHYASFYVVVEYP